MTKRSGSGPWAKGSTTAWRKRRAEKLALNPTCEHEGCQEPAVEPDHIVPRSQGGGDELSNLRSMCYVHHLARHGKRPRPQVDPASGLPIAHHWWSET